MKPLITAILISILVLLSSCANVATRYSLDSGEGVYSYEYDTNKDTNAAYYLSEEWLSSNIRSANDVITLRQVATGTLIANPVMQVPVGLMMFNCGYTLRITCRDNQVVTKFTVGKLDNGTYPPKDAMSGIETTFRGLGADLSQFIIKN